MGKSALVNRPDTVPLARAAAGASLAADANSPAPAINSRRLNVIFALQGPGMQPVYPVSALTDGAHWSRVRPMLSPRKLKFSYIVLTLAVSLPISAQTPPKSRTIKYELKLAELKYVYGELPPVLHIQSGDIVETNTVD